MGSFKFQLVVFGGIAEDAEARVAADTLGDLLKGVTRDVQEVCRNLSVDDDATSLAERVRECRIYVEGPPTKGQSVAVPLLTEDRGAGWGVISMRAYASGVQELRESKDLSSPRVPKGFDSDILKRIESYCQGVTGQHEGFAVVIPAENGTPAVRATFDARLKTAVALKIAAIEHPQSSVEPHTEEPDRWTYGYSVQGVLFEMSDPHYDNPEGTVSVEIDARDGRQWVCYLDKSIVPDNLKDLWKTEVLVVGDALPRARKPLLKARTFQALPGLSDPLKAMDDLISLSGKLRGEPMQAFMDRVRERD